MWYIVHETKHGTFIRWNDIHASLLVSSMICNVYESRINIPKIVILELDIQENARKTVLTVILRIKKLFEMLFYLFMIIIS